MSPLNKNLARALTGAPTLVTATVALMEELIALLRREVELVSCRKITEHAELLKRKQRLAMDYRANMKSMAAQPDLLKSLPDDAKNALREIARLLSAAVDENALMLRAAADATRRLIQNVVAMVRSEVLPKQAYKNTAKAHLQLGTYSPTCRPVAVIRTV